MALPATDSFTTGSDQSLTDYSASWSNAINSHQVFVATEDVAGNVSGQECGSYWNADSFNDDQYSLGIISALGSGVIGVAVRASVNNFYGAYGSSITTYLFEVVAGGWNQLGTDGTNPEVSEEFYLEASGEALTFKVDSVIRIGPTNDDSLTSGSAGLSSYDDDSGTRIDNWEGGNLAVGGRATKNTDPQMLGIRAGISRTVNA